MLYGSYFLGSLGGLLAVNQPSSWRASRPLTTRRSEDSPWRLASESVRRMAAAVASIRRSTSALAEGECASPSARLTKLLPRMKTVGSGDSSSPMATGEEGEVHDPEQLEQLLQVATMMMPTPGRCMCVVLGCKRWWGMGCCRI